MEEAVWPGLRAEHQAAEQSGSRAEQSRAEQSRAEQSIAQQSTARLTLTTIMPSLSARLHQTCRVSVATAFCLSFFRANTVRMLCSLSASFITSTSGSETMFTMNVRSCSSSSLPRLIPRLCPDCRVVRGLQSLYAEMTGIEHGCFDMARFVTELALAMTAHHCNCDTVNKRNSQSLMQ